MSCNCSDQCSTPITIPTGTAGQDGANGNDGSHGGHSLTWKWSTGTGNPAANEITFNTGTYASVVTIKIDDDNFDNDDSSAFLASFDNSSNYGLIKIIQANDNTKWWTGTITAVNDQTDYYQYTVTYIDHNDAFTAAAEVVVSFTPAGAAGSNGSNGSNGTNGTNGVVVLHNDLTTNTNATASYVKVATYTMPGSTISTDGSMIKVKLLLDKVSTAAGSSNVQLHINGVVAHSGIGGTPSNFVWTQSSDKAVLEYTLHRIGSASAACDYRWAPAIGYSETKPLINFENTVNLGSIDWTINIDIDVYLKGNGTDNVNCKGFSVEHYIK
jgi:hypothetical protein